MHRFSVVLVAGVVCQLLALASLVVAYAQREDVAIEGAYFGRDVTAYATSGTVGPWLVAAAALVVAGTALLVVAALRRSRA